MVRLGFWSTSLYGNDITTDVRDSYQELIYETLDVEKAYYKLLEDYSEYFGTEEEPLVWYAIADLQWKYGRIMPEVRDKAVYFIDNDGGIDLWEFNSKDRIKFKNNIYKLKDKLLSPMPKPKKITNPNNFVHNPWSVGDVYAFRFNKDELNHYGFKGKYVVLQKIGNTVPEGSEKYPNSVIQVYDKIFDEIPTLEEVKGLDLLNLDFPDRFLEDNSRPPIMKLIMGMYKKSDYVQKDFYFIGKEKIEGNTIYPWNSWEEYAWGFYLEDYIIERYIDWQKRKVKKIDNKYIVESL